MTGRLTLPGSKGERTIEVSVEEHATILAALRFWQWYKQRNAISEEMGWHDIATSMGEFNPLSDMEIDILCERINVGTAT